MNISIFLPFGAFVLLTFFSIFQLASSSLFGNGEGNHHRRLHCDSSSTINPLVKRGGYDEVDIFPDSDVASRTRAKTAARLVFRDSLDALQSDRRIGNVASLDPKSSDCTWLRINHVERAGLGHTFDAWSYYLRLSIDNRLTYYSPFFSAAHEVCNLNETTAFFGLHSAYYWARSPPANAEVIDVEKATGRQIS
jgi:hypothetical protein